MNIQNIVDFSQAKTEPDRYRPAAEKSSRATPNKPFTTTTTVRAAR